MRSQEKGKISAQEKNIKRKKSRSQDNRKKKGSFLLLFLLCLMLTSTTIKISKNERQKQVSVVLEPLIVDHDDVWKGKQTRNYANVF